MGTLLRIPTQTHGWSHTYYATLAVLQTLLQCFDTFFASFKGILIDVQILCGRKVPPIEGGLAETWVSYKDDHFLPRRVGEYE